MMMLRFYIVCARIRMAGVARRTVARGIAWIVTDIGSCWLGDIAIQAVWSYGTIRVTAEESGRMREGLRAHIKKVLEAFLTARFRVAEAGTCLVTAQLHILDEGHDTTLYLYHRWAPVYGSEERTVGQTVGRTIITVLMAGFIL